MSFIFGIIDEDAEPRTILIENVLNLSYVTPPEVYEISLSAVLNMY